MDAVFEIDRKAGVIRIRRRFLFHKTEKRYPACDIAGITLVRKGVIVEEGYGILRYSVLMKAQDGSLERLSTENAQEALSCYRELNDFFEEQRERSIPEHA